MVRRKEFGTYTTILCFREGIVLTVVNVYSPVILPTRTSYSGNHGEALVSSLPLVSTPRFTDNHHPYRSNERKRRQLFRSEVHGQLPFPLQGMDEQVPSIDFTPTRPADAPYLLGREDVAGEFRVS